MSQSLTNIGVQEWRLRETSSAPTCPTDTFPPPPRPPPYELREWSEAIWESRPRRRSYHPPPPMKPRVLLLDADEQKTLEKHCHKPFPLFPPSPLLAVDWQRKQEEHFRNLFPPPSPPLSPLILRDADKQKTLKDYYRSSFSHSPSPTLPDTHEQKLPNKPYQTLLPPPPPLRADQQKWLDGYHQNLAPPPPPLVGDEQKMLEKDYQNLTPPSLSPPFDTKELNRPEKSWRNRSPPPPPPPYPGPRLPDADKPPLPYTKGQQFVVRRHKPSMPLDKPYPYRRPDPPANFKEQTQLQYCLSTRILEGCTCDEVFSFVVTKELAVRDGRGAQIVVANDNMVAKIFDPLYYAALGEYSGERDDVVGLADRDYTREAAAYEELRDFWGTIIPDYYGSWTCDIATNTNSGPVMRPVRLVFMELINGFCMRDFDPKNLTEEERSNIMVKAIEVETTMIFRGGVKHRDFTPRNILFSGIDLASPKLRVVAIDFNISVVIRLTEWRRMKGTLPVSPIERWSGALIDFAAFGWIPYDEEEEQEWFWKHFGGSPFYQPLIREKRVPCPQPTP